MTGRLIVFEGPDGVGKTTIAKDLTRTLRERDESIEYLSFPGREEGTVGELVYKVHHEPTVMGLTRPPHPVSLQVLHVAAHIDAIENHIVPLLVGGTTVVLDRFWWSTWVYGTLSGLHEESLNRMIEVELVHWGSVEPSVLFLVDRQSKADHYEELRDLYIHLQTRQAGFPVIPTRQQRSSSRYDVEGGRCTPDATMTEHRGEPLLSPEISLADHNEEPARPAVVTAVAPVQVSEVYDTYWRMAFERQHIYYRRLAGLAPPWTSDPILLRHRFTNAYRAADRVSQYLIRHVIYEGPQSPAEVFFRILLFKMFNKIETWELLSDGLGKPRYEDWDIAAYDRVLTAAITSKRTIYSAAYIMPPPSRYGYARKHTNHLALLDAMMKDELPERLAEAESVEVFAGLISYPGVGRFLGYQFAVDLGYSKPFEASESEFVVAGPGARDGIAKCFKDLGGLTESEVIQLVADCQEAEFARLGLEFPTLWGRRLQPIDCQNLFCEVAKYSRVAHPERAGIGGRTRIKQRYRPDTQPLEEPWFPPAWGLNASIAESPDFSAIRRLPSE